MHELGNCLFTGQKSALLQTVTGEVPQFDWTNHENVLVDEKDSKIVQLKNIKSIEMSPKVKW